MSDAILGLDIQRTMEYGSFIGNLLMNLTNRPFQEKMLQKHLSEKMLYLEGKHLVKFQKIKQMEEELRSLLIMGWSRRKLREM